MARPKPLEEKVVVSVQMNESLRKALEDMAYETKTKFPDLIRNILIKAVDRHQKKTT